MKKKLSIKSYIIRAVVYLLVSLVLGFSIYNWNANNLAGNKLPMPFGVGVSVILSGSMEPELSINDLVFITEADEYKVNDVVVFQSGNSLVIHRIIEIDGESVITQGDANNAPDSPIKADEIKGSLAMTVPKAGALVKLLQNPAVAIGLVVAVLLLSELSYRKEKKEEDDELGEIMREIELLTEKK